MQGRDFFMSNPFPTMEALRNALAHAYNECHVRARIVIEQVYGVLKVRFPVLRHMPFRNLEKCAKAIQALFALHNIIVDDGLQNDFLLRNP